MQKVFDMQDLVKFSPETLTYNEAGLVPCISQYVESGEILMMAWMNAESVAKTLETGRVYWSRSRQSSGSRARVRHVQELVEQGGL